MSSKSNFAGSSNTSENQILTGVIWKQILLYFFPLLFGTFFQQLYNTADAIIVGRFVSKQALAAVGGTSATVVNLFVGFFTGVASGATVIISQFYGAKRDNEVSRAVHTAIALGLVGGLIMMLIGLLSTPVFTEMMHTPADTVDGTILYLRVYFCGMIPNLIYNIGAGILRAVGDSKRPLYVLIVCCISNILLDVLFVLILGMGVFGVALATVLCQLISAVLVIWILVREKDVYQLRLREVRLDGYMLKRIIQIGIPAGVQSAMYTISNLIIQTAINGFDTDAVSAWAAEGKIDGIFWMIIGSLGIAITTFVGQNYGAGQYERVRKGIRQSMVITYGITVVVCLFLYTLGPVLFHLFTTDAEVASIGKVMVQYFAVSFLLYVPIEIFSGALRGMGTSFIPMVITVGGVCFLRIFWIFTAVPRVHTIQTVMFSYPLTWTVTSVLFIIYYFVFMKGQMKKMGVKQ